MSLKSDIEEIFRKNTGYAEPEHAINQAESLKSLSVDLYTDSKRFVYELLQNADDSVVSGNSVKVGIRLFDDFLVVAHTGKPFDKRDLRGICGVSDGTKKMSVEKTGYKGIGFKAVFGQSDKVIIYSNGDYFRFDSNYAFGWNAIWGDNQQKWELDNDRLFYYPWQIIPIYTEREELDEKINAFINDGGFTVATIILLSKGKDGVKKAVEQLSSNVNMFLFLKNIQELDFNIESPNVITLNREQDPTTVEIKSNGEIKFSWIIRSVKLQVPVELRLKLKEEKNIPDKLLNATETELTFAAKIDQNTIQKISSDERLLYSYLPTEERKYAFPVLVNSSFVMSSSRETLHEDSKWNEWIFEHIPAELLKWISELVVARFGQSAYELIPIKSSTDNLLASSYQTGLSNALSSIPFILSNKNELIVANQAIIDITSLSKKTFITESAPREFVANKNQSQTFHLNPFLPFTGYFQALKNSGVAIFEWEDIPKLLESKAFLKGHSSTENIQLIQFFKQQCEIENQKNINENKIKNWSFILDHKGNILPPTKIYFPTPDDENWNDPNSEISFLDADVQKFLIQNPETRIWLEKIGVTEKTDLSYLKKTIISNASKYTTLENTLATIGTIFRLYMKSEIGKDELKELYDLEILTNKGNLLPAKLCYFSDVYNPRLKLQTEFPDDDMFISESYLSNNAEKDEWKRFFKMMGVKDGISAISFPKTSSANLIKGHQFLNDYFTEEDKYFTPFLSTFRADEYSALTTLLFLGKSNHNKFLEIFWSDVIENVKIEDFNTPATAYWGNIGFGGRNEGNKVGNYLKWYIQNNDCIPTLMNSCKKVSEVYINTEDILTVAGSYLPIFFEEQLTQDWKAFFCFKTKLLLADYLEILTKIASDTNKDGKVKKENGTRIQSIYKVLLDQCSNWSQEDILKVEEWAAEGYLLSTKNIFVESQKLKFFIDGNESIFQDQFSFLVLNADNKQSPSLEFFLKSLKINILKEGDFKLIHSKTETCSNLIDKLKSIVPYFIAWIENQSNDHNKHLLENLEHNIDLLNIFQADELKIIYEDIDFVKNVNVHFNNFNLFVTTPWNSNSVLLRLPEILCRYFYLLGHDKKLDFLLRSTENEIQQHFAQENINIPENINNENIAHRLANNHNEGHSHQIEGTADRSIIPSSFYHLSRSDFDSLNYAKSIIERAVKNVIKYLQILPEYDCDNLYIIAESVIGGFKKNGNEITVVARPSDDDFILLYYTSEFDVLEYVDAELWCEDGLHAPKQVTLGQLLKKTGINKIPVKNINVSHAELDALRTTPKNEQLEFNAIPFVPQKIAQIISSFANTNGGALIFGIKELNPNNNDIVGLSDDFRIDEIARKAISLLQPIPLVEYDWVQIADKSIFMIKTTKSENDILLDNKKYIRKESKSFVEEKSAESGITLHVPSFNKTIAIIIGIEDYFPKNNISPVKYANSDCHKFKDMLIHKLGVHEDEIYTFTNEEALKNSIEYELKQLFHYLTETDRLIFYYVGHGFHNGITNYLSTYDMHKSNIPGTAVSLRTILLDPLQKSKCKNAIIFIDACAQSFQDENERNQISNIDEEELLLLSNDFPHYATFLSCQTGQSSFSSDNLKNGIWTYHLVEGISGNIPEVIKANKYITDRLLGDYLSTSVAAYTMEELGKHQNPKTILDSSYENVIVEFQP